MTEGTRLSIVLLPGLNGTSRLLEGLRGALSPRQASIVAYPTDRKLGYTDLVPFVHERLPEGRFVILGESFSGPIAIDIAASLPGRVAGLILAVSFVRRPIPWGGTLASSWLSLRLPRPGWAAAAVLMGASATPELKQALSETLATIPEDVAAFRVREAVKVDRREQLRSVACRTLYIKGRRDWLLGDAPMHDVRSTTQRFELAEIDGPHMLLATHAAEAAAVIERFVTDLE